MTRQRTVLAAAALGVLLGMLPAGAADETGPGQLCGFTSTRDPNVENKESAQIAAGPLYVEEPATITCTIQVDASTHAGADACRVTGVRNTGFAFTNGGCSWFAAEDSNIYICTKVEFANGTIVYYNDSNDPLVEGDWSTDPGAACSLAIAIMVDAVDELSAALDPVVCPVLAGPLPPEGDVGEVWDCPPYDEPPLLAGKKKDRTGAKGDGETRRRPPPDPDPTTPFHPAGTIEISGPGSGQVSFSFLGFVPPVDDWSCPISGTSVTCTPPPPAATQRNICGTVTVQATNNGTGTVNGSSRCAQGSAGSASSAGPSTTPGVGSAAPRTVFPWTCAAQVTQQVPGPWLVRCTVGP